MQYSIQLLICKHNIVQYVYCIVMYLSCICVCILYVRYLYAIYLYIVYCISVHNYVCVYVNIT